MIKLISWLSRPMSRKLMIQTQVQRLAGLETCSETGSEIGTETGSETGPENGSETGAVDVSDYGSVTSSETGSEDGSESCYYFGQERCSCKCEICYHKCTSIQEMKKHADLIHDIEKSVDGGKTS